MKRPYSVIPFFAAALAVCSCVGLKEQEDPAEYTVKSLEVRPVDVSDKSLNIMLQADLDAGGKASGELRFLYSTSEEFKLFETVDADDNLRAEILANDYGRTYYVKAVFSNGRNKVESEPVSFSILPFGEYVKLTCPELSAVSDKSANVSASVDFAEGIVPDKLGFELSESEVPFNVSATAESALYDGVMTAEFSSLTPGSTYYVRSFFRERANTVYSNVLTFCTDVSLPSLALPSITGVTFDSALASSEVLSDGGDEITEQGFVFSLSQDPNLENATKVISTDKGVGKFSVTLQELAPGKLYYIKSFAINSKGTAYSLETSFKTGVTLPTVTTTDISAITSSSAKSGGTVTADGGSDVTARGVVWSTEHNPTTALSTKTLNGTGTGTFSSTITGLAPGKTYYVRAYATNVSGTAYGEERSFTTDIALPVVVTSSITDITSDSAKGGGSITSDGGLEITAKGVVWSTSQNPTVSLPTKTMDGTGTSAFTSSIIGLIPSVTYYVRAYATNAKGTAYGEQKSFKAGTEAPTLTTTSVTGITSSSAVCGGNVTFDGGASVTARGVVWSTEHNPTTALSTKTSNGTGSGSFSSTITGLDPGKTYYVCAYATNASGTAYGEEKTFTTDIDLPVVVTSLITEITSDSAQCGGSIISDGGSDIAAKGVVWSTSSNPAVSLSTKTSNGTGSSSFVSSITGLLPGTTYYVRAYATNAKGTTFGNEFSFTTLDYVDLGLPSGLLWAICNLGADKPEESGDFYQWGISSPYSSSSSGWANYKWCNGSRNKLTKYVSKYWKETCGDNGYCDNVTILSPDDDAAAKILNGGWRMPKSSDFQELLWCCISEWTSINGVDGRLFTSRNNGKSLFFPAVGQGGAQTNKYGYYWSSCLDSSAPSYQASMLKFSSTIVEVNVTDRIYAFPIRPVKE